MRNYRLIGIVAFAILLRLVLCAINKDANDNHVEVVSFMVDDHYLPLKSDCPSCYQPKLYYYIIAYIVQSFNIENTIDRIKIMQFVNFLFSLVILFFLFRFISKNIAEKKLQIAVFALFALSPTLLGINIQGTNDTMSIMLGILTIYFLDKLITTFTLKYLIIVILSIVLICNTKVNGIVILLVSMVVLFIKFLITKDKIIKRKALLYVIIFSIISCIVIFFTTNYYDNYKDFGRPFVSGMDNVNPPMFFQKTFVGRAGIISIWDGFFTFRIVDMINTPFITNLSDIYPEHRSSFWSQLYGRSFFIHFDQWPQPWQNTSQITVWIGRIVLVLGLLPSFIFASGLLIKLRNFIINSVTLKFRNIDNDNSWIHLGFTMAFVIFILKFSYDVRDYSCFKPIYILPGLLSFIYIFITGVEYLKKYLSIKMLLFFIWALVITHIIDISYLAIHLYKYYYGV